MTSSIYDKANAVGKYAAKLIFSVQHEYAAESGSSPSSRARLARMRRDLDGMSPSWMLIGDELFTDWPQDLAEPSDGSPEFDRQVNAVRAVLGLYAVHQQSKRQGVAQPYQKDPSKRMTFGRACRELATDLERALITLMRKTDVQVDYGSLARDLYLVQLADKRGKVFQQWGKDYYCWKPVSAQKQQ